MTYTDKAKKWLNERYNEDEEIAVLAFASFLDGEEERKFGDFVDMLSGAPRKEEKPVCEHDNKTYFAREWRCSDCGATGLIPQVVEELHEYDEDIAEKRHLMMTDVDLAIIVNKLNEVIRVLNSLSKR